MEDFIVLLKKIMVSENGYSVEEAERLIAENIGIVVQGAMVGNSALRATVAAIEMVATVKQD